MKPDTHPDYHRVVFQDATTGTAFLTRSTITSSRTTQWEGQTYPLVIVDVTSDPHPFWAWPRGSREIVRTAGQVEKFRKRYGSRRG